MKTKLSIAEHCIFAWNQIGWEVAIPWGPQYDMALDCHKLAVNAFNAMLWCAWKGAIVQQFGFLCAHQSRELDQKEPHCKCANGNKLWKQPATRGHPNIAAGIYHSCNFYSTFFANQCRKQHFRHPNHCSACCFPPTHFWTNDPTMNPTTNQSPNRSNSSPLAEHNPQLVVLLANPTTKSAIHDEPNESKGHPIPNCPKDFAVMSGQSLLCLAFQHCR